MYKIFLFILPVFFCSFGFSGEICNNGIDDDGNGLIDLNDSECVCRAGVTISSFLSNPSFENTNCCPTHFTQMSCAADWMQASEGTTDYYNCAYRCMGAPMPLPDGSGIAATIFCQNWKEYLGACLINPLRAGVAYTLKFYIAGISAYKNGDTCSVEYSPVNVTVYGGNDCSKLPFSGYSSPPSAYWQVIGSARYTPSRQWSIITIDLLPSVDITNIIIGSPANLPFDYPYNTTNVCTPYFLYDGLTLNKTTEFIRISKTGDICANNCALQATANNTGGTWQWYKNGIAISGQTNSQLSVSTLNLGAGNYTALYTLNGNCNSSGAITLQAQNDLWLEASSTPTNNCAISNGSVSIDTIYGGSAPYQYNFNNFGFSSSINYNNLPYGTYNLVAKDMNGCTVSKAIKVDSAKVTFAIGTAVTSACNVSAGSVTITSVTGGTSPYTYNFNNLGFSSTNYYSGLSTGSYPVIVKDMYGCSSTKNVTIFNAPSFVVSSTIVPSSCIGDGQVTINNVTGGTVPYQFNFNNLGFSTTVHYGGLSAGTYSLIVKDINGCTYTTSVVIGSVRMFAQYNFVSGACPNSGKVVITGTTGGTPPYTYNFNNLGFSTTTTYSGLVSADYTLIIKDANGCTYSNIVQVYDFFKLYSTTTSATCINNGSFVIDSVRYGVPPYQYNFNNLGFSSATSYSNLSGGVYTLVIKDATGCMDTTSVNVSPGNIYISWNVTLATCAKNDGAILIYPQGGRAPYLINFNGLGFSPTAYFYNLPEGSYPVTLKDANGCLFTTEIQLETNGTISLPRYSVVPATCNTGGEIYLYPSGGIAPLTYNFNNMGFSSASHYTGLAAGIYSVVIKNGDSCMITEQVTVIGGTITNAAYTSTPATCSNDGSILIGNITGGVRPYQFNLNSQGFSTSTLYNNLPFGTYTLVVKDANGCIYQTNVKVRGSGPPTAIASVISTASCGSANGKVILGAVTGGTPPYQYNFNNLGYSVNTVYQNLSEGLYSLSVKDSNGCTYYTYISLPNTNGPTNVIPTPTFASCGANNGSVVLGGGAVVGGTPPYQYNFNNTGFTTATVYNSLAFGDYPLIVKDANNCLLNSIVHMANTNSIIGADIRTTNANCGAASGTILVKSVIGGTAPYTYSVNNGAFSGTSNLTGYNSGNYMITIKDANNCLFSKNVSIGYSGNGINSVTTAITNTACSANNGTLLIQSVTGGTSPYQYNFNNLGYSSTTSYTGLSAATYPLLVKDANSCIYTTSVTIGNTSGITNVVVTKTDASCGNASGQVVIGTVTGGTSPYQYNFNNLGYSSTTSYIGLSAATYPLLVKDANSCIYTTSVTIGNTSGITNVVVTKTDASCGNASGQVAIGTVTGGIFPYQYNFNNLGYSSITSYTGLSAATYPLLVKDANSCIYTTSVTIGNTSGITNVVVTKTDASCGNASGQVAIGTVTGGTSPYQYNFNNLGYSSTTFYGGLSAAVYPITIKDARGCLLDTTVKINNVNGINSITISSVNPTCNINNGKITLGTVNGGVAPYYYNFNNTGFYSNTIFSALAPGIYPLSIKDANGCLFDTSVFLKNNGYNIYDTLHASICQGQTYLYKGINLTVAANYNDTLISSYACDSIVTLVLKMDSVNRIFRNVAICPGGSYTIGLHTYTQAGTYKDTLKTSLGCDSIVTTLLTFTAIITASQNVTICPGGKYVIGLHTYTQAGVYKDTLQTTFGCDSVITTTISIAALQTLNRNVTLCNGQKLIIGTHIYTTTGIYKDTIDGNSGCDTLLTTNLTVYPTYARIQNISLCTGDFIVVGIKTYTQTGNYIDTLKSINGCDSIITTKLTVNPKYNKIQKIDLCQGGSVKVGTKIYTTTGTYTDSLKTTKNCDSIIITNLTIHPKENKSQNVTICPGGKYVIGTHTYTQASTYKDTLQTTFGCDSVVTTTISVAALQTVSRNVSICSNEKLVIGSHTYITNGIYKDTIKGAAGCDTLLTTTLTVYPKPIVNLGSDISVCPDSVVSLNAGNAGATFFWNNTETTQQISAVNAGTYIVTVTKDICSTNDTIIVQHKPVYIVNLGADAVLCNKDSIVLNVTTNGGNYVWQDGSTKPTYIISQEGIYSVKVTTECTVSADTITVVHEECDCQYYIPTAFSPNNDGVNDKFGVVNSCTGVTYFKLEVFNRWNELLFESNSENNKWNGFYKGNEQELDSYIYILSYQQNNKDYYKKGTFNLLR